ncbi:hypothetical protein EAI_10475 [Harpegnathos saltator]|uniref:Uncharacterized protein n=1 Tax=Harpegnathos saltator TaxID=610380 RepID=E2BXZ2_HARSA|nr:hypothetical protein EAI_10475 [Harpegnathos saltator]
MILDFFILFGLQNICCNRDTSVNQAHNQRARAKTAVGKLNTHPPPPTPAVGKLITDTPPPPLPPPPPSPLLFPPPPSLFAVRDLSFDAMGVRDLSETKNCED